MNLGNHYRKHVTSVRILSTLAAMFGLVALTGWLLDVALLKSVLPGAVQMKANTAISLILAGAALYLLDRNSPRSAKRLGQLLALLVAAIGFVTACEYIFNWKAGIDELLFRDRADAYNAIRGRMSPYSAAVLFALGLGMVCLPQRFLRTISWTAATLALLVGVTSAVGYLWNASEVVTDQILPPVAINTACAFTLLGAGMFMVNASLRFRRIPLSPIEIRTLIGFVVTFVILLLAGGMTYQSELHSLESAKWVDHTLEVRAQLGRLYGALSDAESQQRNYLLTEDVTYLKAYTNHVTHVNKEAVILGRLVADNPAQTQALKELLGLVTKRLALLENTIGVLKRSGLPAAQAIIRGQEGHLLMEQIGATLAEMEAQEVRLLSKRGSDVQKDKARTLLLMMMTMAVGVTGYLVLFNGIRQELISRTQIERALRRSEESLEVTLHSIGDAVLTTDTEGYVTRLNPVAEKLTGWPLAEAQGRPVAEVFRIINSETRRPAVIPVADVLATGEIHALENHTVLIARAGKEYPIADSAAPIRDKEGKTLGVILVFRDITEEQQTERALRDNEQQLRSMNEELERRVEDRSAAVRQQAEIISRANDAVIIRDFATDTVVFWNQGAERLYGWTKEEAKGKHIHSLLKTGFPRPLEEIKRGFFQKGYWQGELIHTRRDDSKLVVRSSWTLQKDENGEPVSFLEINNDITELRNNERIALRSQRLESVGTLAAGLAHDLNNALAPIMMSSEMLRLQYPGEPELVNIIQASAKRGADMVRQLLTFAKGAEGARILVQPRHLLKEMETIIKATFPKNLQLEMRCDANLPTVLGDPTQLHQVLLNLCVNARDAMPNGGILVLECESMEIDDMAATLAQGPQPGKYVIFRIRDTGAGMAPEVLDRIFDPFFTTKGRDKGTGLGLSIVMGIVKGHGGTLQVQSHPGKGSTFAVYLPADRPAGDTEHRSRVIPEFRGNGQTILVIDDEPFVRDIARAVLQRMNLNVLIGTDGADGLIRATEHRQDLRAIITDLHMPNMSGIDFIRAVRRMLPAIPIIAASGRLEEGEKAELQTLGVTIFLDKPFTEQQLLEPLARVLG